MTDSNKWWLWMRNSGFGGSAPFLTLEIHRVNALAGSEYEKMFGTTVGAFHEWKSGTSTKYFKTLDVNTFGESFLEQLAKNPSVTKEWWNETDHRGTELIYLADNLGRTNLRELSDSELLQGFTAVTDAYWRLGVHSSIPLFGGKALQDILEPDLYERMANLGFDQDQLGVFYTALTKGSFVSDPKKEELALRAIAEDIKRDRIDMNDLPPSYRERLVKHAEQFDWIPYKWIGPTWGYDDFLGRLKQMVTAEQKPSAKKMARTQAIGMLHLEPEKIALYDALSLLGDLKEKKGNYMSRGAYQLGKFRKEIMRRFDLSERMTALMLSDDYKSLLRNGEIDHDAILERQIAFLWHAENGIEHFYSGQQALEKMAAEFEWQQVAKTKTAYNGTPVFPGKAAGLARKILRYEKDAGKFNDGDVLIAYRTTPHYVPLMDRSAAIITSEGGITQHAAQIAREHELPCIVGVAEIIDGVEDGQPLLVDAGSGSIEKITMESYEAMRSKTKESPQPSFKIPRRNLSKISGPDVVWLKEAAYGTVDRQLIGNKAANQAALYPVFNVPNGFVATTALYYNFLCEAGLLERINRLPGLLERARSDISQVQSISRDYIQMILGANITGFYENVIESYKKLGAASTVTRSSGIDEDGQAKDGKGTSFAGIFETYLNHRTIEQVLDGIKKCWASLFSPRALMYGARSGLDPSSNQMGVLVQEMKNGVVSGVMYTQIDKDYTMIEACEGLCDPLVAGRITPSLYILDKNLDLVFAKPGNQKTADYIDENGRYMQRPVSNQMPLRKKDLFELGMIGRKTQDRFHVPQDIEWTITNLVYVTQNRDLTSMPMLPLGVR